MQPYICTHVHINVCEREILVSCWIVDVSFMAIEEKPVDVGISCNAGGVTNTLDTSVKQARPMEFCPSLPAPLYLKSKVWTDHKGICFLHYFNNTLWKRQITMTLWTRLWPESLHEICINCLLMLELAWLLCSCIILVSPKDISQYSFSSFLGD